MASARPRSRSNRGRLLSGFSPTDVEQYYLELLDDARFNPAAYGHSLGIDLSGVAPAQPLAMNDAAGRIRPPALAGHDRPGLLQPHLAPGDRPRRPDRRDGVRGHRLGREHRDQHQSRAGQPGIPRQLRCLGCRLQPRRPDRRPGRARTSATGSCCSTSAASTTRCSRSASASRRRIRRAAPSTIARPTPRSTWPRPPTAIRS